MCSGRSKEFPPFPRWDNRDVLRPIASVPPYKAMHFRHRFDHDVLIRRWSQQRRLLARDVNQRNSVLTDSFHWYISCILSQLLHPKKYQEIKKSQNSSYLALTYLPQRQWMNYTTNRTLCLQSIPCPLRGKLKEQLKLFIILSIFRIYCSITK